MQPARNRPRWRLVSTVAVLGCCLLWACPQSQREQPVQSSEFPRIVLIINPTHSNRANVELGTTDQEHSKASDQVIQQVLAHSKFSPVRTLIAGEQLIRQDYARGRDLSLQRIKQDLEDVRIDQLNRAEDASGKESNSSEKASKAPQGDFWGFGTDHSEALRDAADFHDGTSPMLIVMLTDGYNERHPMSNVDAALKDLFTAGPTHLIIVGVSQGQLQAAGTKQTVMQRWEEALQSAGASSLSEVPNARLGYFLTSQMHVLDKSLYRAKYTD